MKWLCRWRGHKWRYAGNQKRWCTRCGLSLRWDGYKWVDRY